MLEFELIDDTENIELTLENNEETIDLTLTDYDDTEVRELIDNVDNKVDELENEIDNIHIPSNLSELTNDTGFIDDTYHDDTKQDKLVSGTNIKTINNQSLLGSGNITIESGAGSYSDLTNKPKINNIELVGNKSLSDLGIQPEGNYIDNQTLESSIDDVVQYVDINIPTALSQLTEDTTHRVVTDTEKETWNNKSNFSGNYTDLTNNPATLKNDTGEVSLYTLVPESGTIRYQFLNSVTLVAPASAGTWRTTLAPGDTVSADSYGQFSFFCPSGNIYMYPVETPITSETLWAGGFCPTIEDVEVMTAEAGNWNVATNARPTGTVNMNDKQMFKKTYASGVTRLTMNFPDEIDDNYKSRLVLNTSASFSTITISAAEYDIYFYGDDCANGVLTGITSKYYDINARADGFGGVLVEVFAKENA